MPEDLRRSGRSWPIDPWTGKIADPARIDPGDAVAGALEGRQQRPLQSSGSFGDAKLDIHLAQPSEQLVEA